MTLRRREERIPAELPVRVWGMDANGKPFSQSATTLDLTRTGVRIGGLQTVLQPGDVVGLQHGVEKARFRVAWIGKFGSSQQGQAGLYSTEPRKYIWGRPLSQFAALAVENGHADIPRWAAPAPPEPPPVSVPAHSGKRQSTRYVCSGAAHLTNPANGFKLGGTVSDISMSGCYVESIQALPTGVRLDLGLTIEGIDILTKAEVKSSHPSLGMGMAFAGMTAEDEDRLRRIIGLLESKAPRIAGKPAPEGTPSPQRKAQATATTNTFARLADEVARISSTLQEAESQLDPRIVSELCNAFQHALEIADAAQKWLPSGGASKDAYKLLDILATHRVQLGTQICKELVMDADAQNIHVGTEGLQELVSAVGQLHNRLSVYSQKRTIPTAATAKAALESD